MNIKVPERIKKHKCHESLLKEYLQIPEPVYKKFKKSGDSIFIGGERSGLETDIETMENLILRDGIWGFYNEDTSVLHIWTKTKSDMSEIVGFISTELAVLNDFKCCRFKDTIKKAKIISMLSRKAFEFANLVDIGKFGTFNIR